jgi:hypothetical protein
MDLPKIETSRLKRLLMAVGTVYAEPAGHFMVDSYYISDALEALDGRTGVSPDEMARLEFMFMEALEDSEQGIPNLERQIAESPAIFAQAVGFAFKRSDTGEDPQEWQVDDAEQRAAAARRAYRLLDQLRRVPGADADGKINAEELLAWITEVRRLCAQHARANIGDQKIGQLLSKAPNDADGLWPCRPVCEAMEWIASPQIAIGFEIGTRNSRGAHWRGEGGAEEREFAAKFGNWARQLKFEFPYVASVLESIAASYDREAEWHDSDARVRKWLRY